MKPRSPFCNVVPIPDPSKLLDLIYLEAHSLIDQIPRRRVMEVVLDLRRVVEECRAENGEKACPLRRDWRERARYVPSSHTSPSEGGTCADGGPLPVTARRTMHRTHVVALCFRKERKEAQVASRPWIRRIFGRADFGFDRRLALT